MTTVCKICVLLLNNAFPPKIVNRTEVFQAHGYVRGLEALWIH